MYAKYVYHILFITLVVHAKDKFYVITNLLIIFFILISVHQTLQNIDLGSRLRWELTS